MLAPTRYRLLLFLFLVAAADFSRSEPPLLMRAKSYHATINIEDYWASEKYDGVRAYWDGQQLLSRSGKIYPAPSWFTQPLPNTPLDGELWLGRQQFDQLSGIVRKHKPQPQDWKNIRYMVFDLPRAALIFDQRLAKLTILIADIDAGHIQLVPQKKFTSQPQLINHLNNLVNQGAEGLMLHKGSSYYHHKRNDDLLKLKQAQDAEAIVIKIIPGRGKYKGLMGAILVAMPDGKRFKIGSGFSDKERANPPALGSLVTYQYNGLSQNGIPRFARFLRQRYKH